MKKGFLSRVCVITLLVFVATFMLPVNAGSTTKTQAEAVAWIKAQVGQWIDMDGVYGAQCADLAVAYYLYLGAPWPYGNAIDFASNALPSGWQRVYSNPQPGDVVVYSGYPASSVLYGHIALCYAVSSGRPLTVDQNVGGTNGQGQAAAGKYCDWGTSGVACYIRPNFSSSGNNPIGTLDQVQNNAAGGIRIRGWAFDPDQKDTSLDIHVYIGGTGVNMGKANLASSDVNSVHGLTGNHRFDWTVTTDKRGNQSVQIYAINVGGGSNAKIWDGTVNITDQSPIGTMDQVTGGTGSVRIRGWAFDPDAKANSIGIHVYIGGDIGTGQGHDMGKTPLASSDVNSVYGLTGNHRFDWTIATDKTGSVAVHVYMINEGPGANKKLWSGSVTVNAVTHAVTFNANGGSNAPANQTKTKGTILTLSKNVPVRDGYIFKGWSTSTSGTVQYFPDGQYGLDQDITLYAVWEQFTKAVIPDAYYWITPKHATSTYIETLGGNKDNGTQLQIWQKHSGLSAQFQITRQSDGSYEMIGREFSMAVEVQGASREVGSKVNQYTDNNSDAQRWWLADCGDGYYKLINKASGLVWDVQSAATANGTKLMQNRDNGGNNQRFSFTPLKTSTITFNANGGSGGPGSVTKYQGGKLLVPNNTPTLNEHVFRYWNTKADDSGTVYQINANFTPDENTTLYAIWMTVNTIVDGIYFLSPQCAPDSNVEIAEGNTDNNTQLRIWTEHKLTNQQWDFKKQADGSYSITNVFSEKSIDNTNASLKSGDPVCQYTSNGSSAQSWYIINCDNNYYKFVNKASGYCLDVSGAKSSNDTKMIQFVDNNSIAQRFTLTPLAPTSEPNVSLDAPSANMKAYSVAGRLSINVLNPAFVTVYTLTGKLLTHLNVEKEASIALPQGIYIVKSVSGSITETVKIINN